MAGLRNRFGLGKGNNIQEAIERQFEPIVAEWITDFGRAAAGCAKWNWDESQILADAAEASGDLESLRPKAAFRWLQDQSHDAFWSAKGDVIILELGPGPN